MSTPKYAPRDFLVIPTSFGRPGLYLTWIEQKGLQDQTLLRAAQMQDEYVVRIRMALKRRGISKAEYAASAGISYDRFLKMMRGDAVMRIEDLASADLLVGHISEFDPRNDQPHGSSRRNTAINKRLGPTHQEFRLGSDAAVPRRRTEYGYDSQKH